MDEVNERLRAENAQLRAALAEALGGWEGCWTSDNNDPPPPEIAALRAHLEPKETT